MNSRIALLLVAATAALPLQAATDGEVNARREAAELAGAFSNDGFKLRDGAWQGQLTPGKAQLLQVNLYAGNQYWFSLATGTEAKQMALSVHDEQGQPLATEPYHEANRYAAGFSPKVSGAYYIRIEEQDGEPASFCLLYSYK